MVSPDGENYYYYKLPSNEQRLETWDDAWQLCKNRGGFLPKFETVVMVNEIYTTSELGTIDPGRKK